MIGQGLLRNLIHLLTPANKTDLLPAEQSDRMSSRVLTLILGKVAECGATGCELDLALPEPRYTFRTADGHNASGSISPRIREELIEFCDRNLGSISLGSFKSARILGRVNAGVYALSWGPAVQSECAPMTHNVVVIDDNPTFVKVVHRFLGRQGIQVETFTNGNEALKRLTEGARPAAVVCDLHMAELGGLEILSRAKAHPHSHEIPFVMLTSDDDVEVELRLLERGAEAFISKSTDPRILCAHVKRLVEQSKPGRRVA